MRSVHHAPRRRASALLGLLGLALGSCLELPPPYAGDYSEFRAARAAEQDARAARQREREAARAAAPDAGSEAPSPAPSTTGAVQPTPARAASDADLAAAVHAALARELAESRLVTASVEAAVVTLEGVVRDAGEAAAAVVAASRVDGVRAVYDLLELAPREELGATRSIAAEDWFSPRLDETLRKLAWSDHDVARAVEAALARAPELDASRIDVRVEGRLAVLEGEVSSARERRAAADLARRAGGRGVRNEIRIVPAGAPARDPGSPF